MKFICWWKGHKYDKEKYISDLYYFHLAHHKLPLMKREDIENFYKDPPLPYCLRCKKVLNKNGRLMNE